MPDNIANQIAAGEVIQRPASAVKELLENAVDAGATEIRVIIGDAGKSLVQVIDNGSGMSETDARNAFERHATSKIRNIDDLFRIRTMGFRGEALASIAAVAQVQLKTKREIDESGTCVEIENSAVSSQEPVATLTGTSIAMKNLFFNVPARRNFLKSNAAEMRHILDEFVRVALAFPGIFFSVTSNGEQLFNLEKGTLKQRIIQLLGDNLNAKLVSVNERTAYLNIRGFVGKPEAAKKTRGDQYLFVNNRFIRSAYLNHAVMGAFQQMIPADSFPLYILFIDLDPAELDINVHPTKQEIKFQDEKIVYAFVQAAVKHALAQFSITPTLDFNLDPSIQQLDAVTKPFTEEQKRGLSDSSLFKTFTQKDQAHFIEGEDRSELRHWKEFFEPSSAETIDPTMTVMKQFPADAAEAELNLNISWSQEFIQVHHAFIVARTDKGFILINQQLAHERILYERYQEASEGKSIPSQKNLFPVTVQLAMQDAMLLSELLGDLRELGYDVEPFGKDAFIIQGTPADLQQANHKAALESILEQYKHYSSLKLSRREKLIRSLAWQDSIKPGAALAENEISRLLEDLFLCKHPNVSPGGRPTYVEYDVEYLTRLFEK